MRHRDDIDGLRAIAVVLVVLFHARVPGFELGYLGVDIFFPIHIIGPNSTHVGLPSINGCGVAINSLDREF